MQKFNQDNTDLLATAWAEFEKANRCNEMRQAAERAGDEFKARIAAMAAAKHLDRAMALEDRFFVAKAA